MGLGGTRENLEMKGKQGLKGSRTNCDGQKVKTNFYEMPRLDLYVQNSVMLSLSIVLMSERGQNSTLYHIFFQNYKPGLVFLVSVLFRVRM